MDDNPPADRHDVPVESGTPDAQTALKDVGDRIIVIRGRRVMLDRDLAMVYSVSPKRLNEQVKRNRARFPDDFIFRLTSEEVAALTASRSQSATLKKRGHNMKYAPYAFTEHGALMLAAVLNSPSAIGASIQVVRAFVRLRATASMHEDLAQKLEALERRFDQQFRVVFHAIRQLMAAQRVRSYTDRISPAVGAGLIADGPVGDALLRSGCFFDTPPPAGVLTSNQGWSSSMPVFAAASAEPVAVQHP